MMNFFKIMQDNSNKENSNIIEEEEEKKDDQKEKEPPSINEKEKDSSPIKEEKEIEIHDFYRCPKCNEIPFIKIDKINYTLITECNNNHTFNNISVEKFISDLKKANQEQKDKEKNKFSDSICSNHKEKYINYCKTCKINLCMYCDYSKHESHDVKLFFPIISDLDSKISETKLRLECQNDFIEAIEKWRKQFNEKILAFETFLKNSLLLIKYNTKNIDIKNINYQIIQNYYELSGYESKNFPIFKEFTSTKNFFRKGGILLKILNSYESNISPIKKNKLINDIEIKYTLRQSAYPFNYFSLKDNNFRDNIIGLINDETIRIYSISSNGIDFEMQEKLIINESKNINYLSKIETNEQKSDIIICVDNQIKIIKILIEENNIIGYEEKKIFDLKDTLNKVISNNNKIFTCDKSTITVFQNNLKDSNENNMNEDDWYNYQQINEIKAEAGNNIYDIINISQEEIASVQKGEKNKDEILIYFYSVNDFKIVKNINLSIEKNDSKESEGRSGAINGYSTLMINNEVLGLIYSDYLFLINTKNKEAIKTIRFEAELFFIEKYIDDSFVLNRKIKNKEKNDQKAKTSNLYQYKIDEKNELIELGENKEITNLSEFKYFIDYDIGISTSYDNNIVSVWN